MLCGMWDLPGPGTEPVSPALAGEFLFTVPPGKSRYIFHCVFFFFFQCQRAPALPTVPDPLSLLPFRPFFVLSERRTLDSSHVQEAGRDQRGGGVYARLFTTTHRVHPGFHMSLHRPPTKSATPCLPQPNSSWRPESGRPPPETPAPTSSWPTCTRGA